LAASCPQLEDLQVNVAWDALLAVRPPLPLRRLVNSGRKSLLSATHLRLLPAAFPGLEELGITVARLEPAALFACLEQLPRLTALTLATMEALYTDLLAPAPPEEQRRPLNALRCFRFHVASGAPMRLAELLPFFA